MMQDLRRFVCEIANVPAEEVQIEALAGDASTRRYYRVRFSRRNPYETAVLMWMPELPSEGELPFINIRRHLAQFGVEVPQIYHFSKKYRCLLIEDCGDLSLQEAIRGKGEKEILELYFLAMDEIFKMQFLASQPRKECSAFQLAFDLEKLSWELNFFLEHTLCGFLGVKLAPAEERIFESFARALSLFLAERPRVFTHRDFHARNLLVQDGKIKVIDFQDARMGPEVYDLASLVFDSYADLDPGVRQTLIDRYAEAQKEKQKKNFSTELFAKTLDWMKLQRSLKAAGTFGFMARARQNDRYLPYLPRVFQYAREVLPKYSEFKVILPILEPYLKMFEKKARPVKARVGTV